MPLYKQHEDEGTLTGIWRMTESLEELEAMYTVHEAERHIYVGFRNDRRRKEWLTVRILLRELMGTEVKIRYKESGKPYLIGSDKYISITHTIGYVGIRLGNRPVAIDMEYKSKRVINLIPRFVSEAEMRYIDPKDQITSALVIWSAKESLYKLFDISDILFDEHLAVRDLDLSEERGSFCGILNKGNQHCEVELHYWLHDDLILVYY